MTVGRVPTAPCPTNNFDKSSRLGKVYLPVYSLGKQSHNQDKYLIYIRTQHISICKKYKIQEYTYGTVVYGTFVVLYD